MIQNQGFTKTVLYNNNKEKMSEIKWDANYDGKNAHVLLNINKDGKKQKIDMNLDNSDLAQLLNIPSVSKPLEERLMLDFKPSVHNHTPQIQMIELPSPSPYTHISSPRSFEEFIRPLSMIEPKYKSKKRHRRRKTQKLTKVKKSKSKTMSSKRKSSRTKTTTSRKYTM